jgi:hypothetical protein
MEKDKELTEEEIQEATESLSGFFSKYSIPVKPEENDNHELINRAGDIPSAEEIAEQINKQTKKEEDQAESFDRPSLSDLERTEEPSEDESEEFINRPLTPSNEEIQNQIEKIFEQEKLESYDRTGDIPSAEEIAEQINKQTKKEEDQAESFDRPSLSDLERTEEPSEDESEEFINRPINIPSAEEIAEQINKQTEHEKDLLESYDRTGDIPSAEEIAEQINKQTEHEKDLLESYDRMSSLPDYESSEEESSSGKTRLQEKAEVKIPQETGSSLEAKDSSELEEIKVSKEIFEKARQEYISKIRAIAKNLNISPEEFLKKIYKKPTKPQEIPQSTEIIDVDFKEVPNEQSSIEEKKVHREKIDSFLKLAKKKVNDIKSEINPESKNLFDKLIKISKSKYMQAAIGAAILGISITVPPVGGAAFLTVGAINGFLPAELGIATKVIGGAAGGFLIRKLIENKNNSKKQSQSPKTEESNEEEASPEQIKSKITLSIPETTTKRTSPEQEQAPTPEKNSKPIAPEIPNPPEELPQTPEPIISTSEKKDEKTQEKIDQTLETIRMNLNKQPTSTQMIYPEMKNKFESFLTINGKDYLFAGISQEKVLALVKDEESPGVWKTRFFRYSKSDNQWKALPGERPNKSFLKGDEENPRHHYVQSAKLDKNIYKALESLKTTNNYNFENYIPREASATTGEGQFTDEIEFKEEPLPLQNKEWIQYQDSCQKAFKLYEYFINENRKLKDLSPEGGFYKKLVSMGGTNFDDIKNAIDEAYQDEELKHGLKENLDNVNKLQTYKISSNPKYKKIADAYEKNIGTFLEKMFQVSECPKSMDPDFSEKNIVDTYKKGDVTIEEYEVKSPEGDDLIFAMSYDKQGRVCIDNIYDPRVKINDYGIPEKICQMGHLIFKPEDYNEQVFGIPEKYKKELFYKSGEPTGYTDINAFWQNIPLIKKYKEELEKRNSISEKKEESLEKEIDGKETINNEEFVEALKNGDKDVFEMLKEFNDSEEFIESEEVQEAAREGFINSLKESVQTALEIKRTFDLPKEFIESEEVQEAIQDAYAYYVENNLADDALEIKEHFLDISKD